MNLAETLVEADLNGNLIPALATDWRSNEEGTIWRFTLREGVKFHNDQVLTAQAVVNSLNIAKSKPGVLAKAFIKEIRAVDNKVEIELTKAFVPFPPFLTHYTALILAPESYNEKGEVTQIIGTGAFKPTKIEAPQKLEAVQFEGYWAKNRKFSKPII